MVTLTSRHPRRVVRRPRLALFVVSCLVAGSHQSAFAQLQAIGCVAEPVIGKTVGVVTSFRQDREITSYGSVEIVRRTIRRAVPERLREKGYDATDADGAGLPADVRQWPRKRSDVAAAIARQNLTALVVVEFEFYETQSLWSLTTSEGQPGMANYRTFNKTYNAPQPMPAARWSEWVFGRDGAVQCQQTGVLARAGWAADQVIQAQTYEAMLDQLVTLKVTLSPKPVETWAGELAADPLLLIQVPRFDAGPADLAFASVSAGMDHACALTPGGAAYCWGGNGFGQLGGDASEACPWNTPNFVAAQSLPCSPRPIAVSGGLSFKSIRAGHGYTCGLTPAGEAYCWGRNAGQLGDGTRTNHAAPARVAVDVSFDSLYLESYYACGLTAAGEAHCWGANDFGQLGDSTRTDRATPALVKGGLTFATLVLGFGGACGLTPTGAAYCWGGMREIGPPGQKAPSLAPVAVGGVPLAMLKLTRVGFACGLGPDGTGSCWSPSIQPIPLGGGVKLGSISFTADGKVCGPAQASKDYYCWERDSFTAPPRRTRQPSAPGGGETRFTAISSGGGYFADAWVTDTRGLELLEYRRSYQEGEFSCGVTDGGAVYCWGANYRGQLGDRTKTAREAPVRVR